MKDLIEARFTIATRKLEGKTAKAIAKTIGKALEKVEPQIMRLAEAVTKTIEDEVTGNQNCENKEETK